MSLLALAKKHLDVLCTLSFLDRFTQNEFLRDLSSSRSRAVQDFSILFEALNHLLAALATYEPVREALSHGRVLGLLADQQMRRVQQGIVLVVAAGFIYRRLLGHVSRKSQPGAPVRDGVFSQLDRCRQRLDREGNVLVIPGRVGGRPGDLADADEQLGLLDIRGGFVEAAQKPDRGGARPESVCGFSGGVEVREHVDD